MTKLLSKQEKMESVNFGMIMELIWLSSVGLYQIGKHNVNYLLTLNECQDLSILD